MGGGFFRCLNNYSLSLFKTPPFYNYIFSNIIYMENLKNINIKLREDKREQLKEMIKHFKLEQLKELRIKEKKIRKQLKNEK